MASVPQVSRAVIPSSSHLSSLVYQPVVSATHMTSMAASQGKENGGLCEAGINKRTAELTERDTKMSLSY